MKKTALCIMNLLCLLFIAASCRGDTVIGYVKSSDNPAYKEALEGFMDALKKEHICCTLVECPPDPAALPEDGRRPDIIVTFGTRATEKYNQAPDDIPVVFAMVLRCPQPLRKNMTGVTMAIPPEASFKMLKRIMPWARNVGLLFGTLSSPGVIAHGDAAAARQGLTIVSSQVQSLDGVYDSVRAMNGKIDVLWMIPDNRVYTPKSTEDILLYALREKIPVIGLSPSYVKAGALFCLSADHQDTGRQAAAMAARIIGGEDASAIAVAPPRTHNLALNLIVAGRLGIRVPPSLIRESKHVFQ